MVTNRKHIKTDLSNIAQATLFVFQSDKQLFVVRLVLIVLQSILPLLTLYVLKLLIDTVTIAMSGEGVAPISSIWAYAGAFSGIFLLSRLFIIFNQVSDEILTQKLIDFISNLLHKKSTELDLAYYDNAEYHDTFHRAQQEANYRPIQILDNLTGILKNSLSLVGIVVLLFTFSWLGIVIMLVAGLPSLGVKLVCSKVMFNWRKKNTHLFRKANYFSMLMTNRTYAKEIRVFNQAPHFQEQFINLRTQLVKQIKQGIRFENISFKYPGSEKWVLQNYSLIAAPGEVTTIDGENGAGKTPLIKLLCRLYECTEGRITIDSIDIRQFNVEDLRKNISVLFQDFSQYDLTAGENILLGNIYSPQDKQKVQQAAALGCAAPVIDQLPDAYNTLLGKYFDKGEELSMGQWQRMALARAIYKNAPILVLDEPTSWLDATATNLIKQNLSQLSKGRIVLLISHTIEQKNDVIKRTRRSRI